RKHPFELQQAEQGHQQERGQRYADLVTVERIAFHFSFPDKERQDEYQQEDIFIKRLPGLEMKRIAKAAAIGHFIVIGKVERKESEKDDHQEKQPGRKLHAEADDGEEAQDDLHHADQYRQEKRMMGEVREHPDKAFFYKAQLFFGNIFVHVLLGNIELAEA